MPKIPSDEKMMYGPVAEWLRSMLAPRFSKWDVQAAITSNVALNRWLERNSLHTFFAEYLAYEIQVDVVGVFRKRTEAHLAFVECKLNPITLKDISQLLGYCRVAHPEFAWILSPNGISTGVAYLLDTYHRYDVLEYAEGRRIKVATWNHDRKDIVAASLLPPGEHLI